MSAPVLKLPVGSDETAEYLGRVRILRDEIIATASQIESEKRIPQPLLNKLHSAGLFKMLLPKCYGGGEVHPVTFFRTVMALAACDGSVGWCVGQQNGCSTTAAAVEPEVANKIWASDSVGALAWGPGKGTAMPHDAGYRINGSWMFASGGRHCSWLGAQTTAVLDKNGNEQCDEEGKLVTRTFLIPADKVQWKDIWNVIGLKGTASDAFTVKNVYVPAIYSIKRDRIEDVRIRNPLYAFRTKNLYAASFAGVALGLARGLLEEFKELASEKRGKYGKTLLMDNAVAQADTSIAEARIRSATAYIESEFNGLYDDVLVHGALTADQRVRIRLASTFAIQEAKAAADVAYQSAGATAIFASQNYERRYRDLHAVTQQTQGHKVHYQTVGSYLLGNEPELAAM